MNILTCLQLLCYSLHSILVKCLSKCMFERSLNNNICRLIDTCAICWNVKNMNFGMMILHPLPKFFADMNTLASMSQIISCIVGRFNSSTCKSLYGTNIFSTNSLYMSKVDQWLWLKVKFHHACSQSYLPPSNFGRLLLVIPWKIA